MPRVISRKSSGPAATDSRQSNPWKLEEKSVGSHKIHLQDLTHGREQWALVMSDLHWDHPKCRLDILKSHCDEALKRKAPIFSFGDHYCCMQGKGDLRSAKGDVRPEHMTDNYLDSLVETCAEWFSPYKNNLALIGPGNHEKSVRDRHETDLVGRTCERLRTMGGITRSCGYVGFVSFIQRQCRGRVMAYHHGWGGGAGVGKGVSHFTKWSSDQYADIYVTGHIHEKTFHRGQRLELNQNADIVSVPVYFLRMGSYKSDFNPIGGYAESKGHFDKPLGGWWMRLSVANHNLQVHFEEAQA
jgi:hypothetical protein